MKIKKIISVAMFLIILFAMINSSSFALTLGDFIIENGVLTKYTGSGGSVTIPENMGIRKIGEYVFYDNDSIKSVVIPHGVTAIEQSAFDRCSNLNSVTLPTSVTEISNYAFFCCRSLSSVNIPAGLSSVGICAFSGTDISSPILVNNGRTLCHVPETYSEYEIPKTVNVIGGGAFFECYNLSSILIPDGITLIDHSAFAHCVKLTTVTIPHSVTSIGANAFFNCVSLKTITIPDSVTSIGTCPFDLTDLSEPILINYGKTLCYIPTTYFEYTIPSSVTRINGGAFKGCSSLKSVVIPSNVTEIDNFAFSGCVSLTSVKLPAGLKAISYHMFAGCSSLTAISIPNGVTMINFNAFSDCSNLSAIQIPDSVTTIMWRAFIGCNSLKMIRIPSGVKDIRDGIFDAGSSVIMSVQEGSVAHTYAISNGIEVALDKAALPAQSTVLINGVNVNFDAYTIDENNYFKLRDLAMALNGTTKQFEVIWDEANSAIRLTTNSAYTSVGNELTVSENRTAATAISTTSRIYMDGVEINLKAYQIGSSNYFKLRDVGAVMNFGIEWEDSLKTIVIDTSTGYTAN